MTIDKKTTHVIDAKARVPGHLQNATNFNKLVEVFVNRYQQLEDELDDLLNNVTDLVINAIGVQLDIIGIILDLTRIVGEGDSEYRIRLLGEAAALAKSGEPETVIDAYKLITTAIFVLLIELEPATIELIAEMISDDFTVEQDAAIIATMQDVIAAGIGTILEICVTPCFLWGDSINADANGDIAVSPNGLGDEADADANGDIAPGVGGGNFARVI